MTEEWRIISRVVTLHGHGAGSWKLCSVLLMSGNTNTESSTCCCSISLCCWPLGSFFLCQIHEAEALDVLKTTVLVISGAGNRVIFLN